MSWVAWICGIGGLVIFVLGFAGGRYDAGRIHRSPAWARMVSSAALVLAALVWWWTAGRATPLAAYTFFLFAGMLCSFVGDLTMAQLLPLKPHLPFGMLAFGAAHGLYLCGYAQAGQALGLDDPRAWAGGIAGGLVLAALMWWAVIHAPGSRSVLDYGALGYGLLLGAMAGAAVALALQWPRFWVLAAGALLFLASDALLGNRLFRHHDWPLVGDAVWALYIAGQALIVFSTAALLE